MTSPVTYTFLYIKVLRRTMMGSAISRAIGIMLQQKLCEQMRDYRFQELTGRDHIGRGKLRNKVTR